MTDLFGTNNIFCRPSDIQVCSLALSDGSGLPGASFASCHWTRNSYLHTSSYLHTTLWPPDPPVALCDCVLLPHPATRKNSKARIVKEPLQEPVKEPCEKP